MDSRVISKSVVAICIEAIGEIKYPPSDILAHVCKISFTVLSLTSYKLIRLINSILTLFNEYIMKFRVIM